ncbi:MAG: biotin/lipoyl-containing protein, partial [Acidimicrobiales bacterium]
MADITMPQLGETVVEGTIIKWFKKVGDPVARDETLFEVSTDKVDSEVPSVAEGFLAEILVAEGETVDVGTRLAVVTQAEPAAGGAPAPAPAEDQPADAMAASPGDEPVDAPDGTASGEHATGGNETEGDRATGQQPDAGPAPSPPA